MIIPWIADYRPSLRRWSRVVALMGLAVALLATPVAISLLDEIYIDANTTYSKEIPDLLARNRNAVKLERLSSFTRAIATSNDAKIERTTFVELQALAQDFDFETDARLTEGAHRVVANARKIVQLRAARRIEAARSASSSAATKPAIRSEPGGQTEQQLSDESIGLLASLIDAVTTDAALQADTMAGRIQRNAGTIKQGSVAILTVLIVLGLLLFWVFQSQILRPIAAAVRGLEAISSPEGTAVTVPRARFSELDTIGRSVAQYARFVAELQTANSALHTLSNQDGLTALPNRRSFDLALKTACRLACEGRQSFVLLLIDIDHFKLLNDRLGHLAGDRCLQQIGRAIEETCLRRGFHAARYGGEEFAVVAPGLSADGGLDLAQRIRSTIAGTKLDIGGMHGTTDVTVSIGATHRPSGLPAMPDTVIREADEALYRAKHSGRNRACLFAAEPVALPRAS